LNSLSQVALNVSPYSKKYLLWNLEPLTFIEGYGVRFLCLGMLVEGPRLRVQVLEIRV
jgi:hypothetical protein